MSRVIYSEWRSAPKSATYFRIELHKVGFVGSARRVNAQTPFMSHRYTSLNPREPQKTPILDSTLTYHFRVESAQDVTLLEDIFASNPGVYTIKKYVNNALEWTGEVDTDRIEYDLGAFPFPAKIIARDLAPQRGRDYPLTNDRVTIIAAIAEMLPLDLPIRTYTSWKEGSLTSTQDFLRNTYINRTALREFARTGDQPDETIDKFFALQLLARNFGLIIRQSEGAWRIYQLTALVDPTTVRLYFYSSAGEPVAPITASADLTVQDDRDELFLIPRNQLKGLKSYKDVRARFDHRTTVELLKLPQTIRLDDDTPTATFTQFLNTDGNQSYNLRADVDVFTTEDSGDVFATVQIRQGQYYWDGSEWTEDPSNILVELSLSGPNPDVMGEFLWRGGIIVETTNIPNDATGVFTITLTAFPLFDSRTVFRNTAFSLTNPSVEDGNNTAIDYKLTQVRDASARYDHGAVWFGDGPTSYAVSAISRDVNGETLTASSWGRQGETLDQDVFELLTREVMDTQRFASRYVNANVWGGYSIGSVIDDSGDYYFFIGGTQSGRDNIWQGEWLKINIQTAETDTFEIIYRTTADDSTGSAPAGGSTGGGGLTQTIADARYNQRSLNLSDVASVDDARENLRIGDEWILDYNLPLFDAGEGDESVIDIRDASDAVRGVVNTIAQTFAGLKRFINSVQIDTGKLLSTNDFALRNETDTGFKKLSIAQGTGTNEAITGARTLTGGTGVDTIGNLTADRTISTIPATELVAGHVSTGTQRFAGEKTFDDPIILEPQAVDPSVGVGKVWFDEDLQTLSFYDENDNITRVNQQVTVRVKNTSGASIAKGVPVRVCTSGFAGDLVCVRPAQGDTATNSNVIGVTAEAIADNAVGTAIEFGKLENVNTNSFNIGDTLFLSPTVAGGLTTTKPTYSDFAIRIGIVTRKSTTEGAILILIEQNFDIFTSDRVMFANGDGRIAEDSVFTFDGDELRAPSFLFTGLIESDSFADVAGDIDGFRVLDNGELKTRSIRANAMVVKSFTAEVAQIFRGELAISKSFGILARDFTVPEPLSIEDPLVIHDVEGFGGFNVFENNDIVELKLFYYENGGKLVVGSAWGIVTNATPNTPATGLQSYDFETLFVDDNALIGETVFAGAEARSYGSSASPVGVIVDSVFSGVPNRDVYTWTTNPYTPANRTIRSRLGDLDGLSISGVSGYGLYTSNAYLTGSLLVGDLTKTGNYLEFADGELDVNTTILKLTTDNLVLDSSVPKLALGADAATQTLSSGTGFFVNGTGEIRAGATNASHMTFDTTNGLRFKAGSSVLAQLSGDTFKIGTTNFIEFDSDSGELDINTTILKLTTPGLVIDSSIPEKIIVNDGVNDVVKIGDFDFGSEVNIEDPVSSTTGATTSGATTATVSYPTGGISPSIGVMNNFVAEGSNIIQGVRTLQNIRGKWVRIRFDWQANGYDSSLPAFAVGYEIIYPLGKVENLTRDPLGAVESGSVDTGYVFMPDSVAEGITVRLLAPVGDIQSGDVHERAFIENLVVEAKSEKIFVDIGKTGIRAYNAGGLNALNFEPGKADATFTKVGIGDWEIKPRENGALGFFYKGNLRETITTS